MPSPPDVDTLARIETPESVRLAFRLAGPWVRLWAYLLDLTFRVVAGVASFLFAAMLTPLFSLTALPIGVWLIGLFLLEWGYPCLFESLWNGKTPGKHLMHIRVVKTAGSPIGFYDAMLRNLLRAADALPVYFVAGVFPAYFYGVGLFAILATRRFQRLGDLAAGTMVVHEERPEFRTRFAALGEIKPLPRTAMAGGYRPPERVLDLIDRLYRRRGSIHRRRAAEIAATLAPAVRDRLGYEDPDGQCQEAPALFLLRVLRTFSEPEDHEPETRSRPGRTAREARVGPLRRLDFSPDNARSGRPSSRSSKKPRGPASPG